MSLAVVKVALKIYVVLDILNFTTWTQIIVIKVFDLVIVTAVAIFNFVLNLLAIG